jgi:hypothetical protein
VNKAGAKLRGFLAMLRVLRLLARSLVLCMFVVGMAQARSLMLTAVPNMASSSKLRAMYAPLVRYLSTMTGRPVRFHNPYTLNVLGYMVMKHRPAVLFAGPHIIDWAIKHAGYQPVLAGTGHLHFVLVAKKPGVTLPALRGALVCGLPPPNLATLALFAKFRGHVSTPYIVLAHSPKTALAGVLAGRCVAAAVPIKVAQPALAKHVVYTVTDLGTYPDLAFAISPRLGSKLRLRVTLALRATEARPALAPLARAYHIPRWFHPSDALYTGLSHLLNAYPGFSPTGGP